MEVFAKHYCLHWQKRKIGHKIAQFGSCTFTPRTRKTSMEVMELVPCARNKWGNWWDFWFYISEGEVEDHPGLPVAVMCSHYYVAYPQFEVAEDDEDEGALRCAARMSSGRDLVEEFIGYGVWPLAHGWALGEVCPREMPSLGGHRVRSPAFALDLHGRDPAAIVHEAEDGATRIVGRYVPRTESLWSWDIRGSNVRLNRVFELNCLPYGGYPRDDAADRRGKKLVDVTEEGPSQEAAPATKKRKLGTAVGAVGVSDSFAVDLMGTCTALGGRMSSSELRESSARMLEVIGGRWPKNVPIPRAAGEDFFTSRMARDLKVFPYGRNIAAVVSAVMERDRQDATQKRRAVVRIVDPMREAKKARGARRLLPLAVANRCRLRNRPPPGTARRRRVQRLLPLAGASHLRALTVDVAAEVERLQAQHADAVREKSAAESKNRRLSEKVAAMEAEKTDLRHQLAEERREANKAIADA
jgi:hypothetical protein